MNRSGKEDQKVKKGEGRRRSEKKEEEGKNNG